MQLHCSYRFNIKVKPSTCCFMNPIPLWSCLSNINRAESVLYNENLNNTHHTVAFLCKFSNSGHGGLCHLSSPSPSVPTVDAGAVLSPVWEVRRLGLGSPEGPSSASGWCVATVVACTRWEASSPWSEASPWEAAVCGADTWSVCSLSADLRSKDWTGDSYRNDSIESVPLLIPIPSIVSDVIVHVKSFHLNHSAHFPLSVLAQFNHRGRSKQ